MGLYTVDRLSRADHAELKHSLIESHSGLLNIEVDRHHRIAVALAVLGQFLSAR
jgi:hypothetical protein